MTKFARKLGGGRSDLAIHLTASIIGGAGAILSRMRGAGSAGASKARALNEDRPLAKFAAKVLAPSSFGSH
jgi:hypothetical protein